MRRAAAAVALALVIAGAAASAFRVWGIERREVQSISKWKPLASERQRATDRNGKGDAMGPTAERDRARRRIAEVDLRQGQSVQVELCSDRPLRKRVWAGRAAAEVRYLPGGATVQRTELDRRIWTKTFEAGTGTCIVVARAQELPDGGRFAIELRWDRSLYPEQGDMPAFRARVQAWSPLTRTDHLPVLASLLGVLLALVVPLMPGRGPPHAGPLDDGTSVPSGRSRSAVLRLLTGLSLLLSVGVVLALMPWRGSSFGMVRGFALAGIQVGAALLLVRPAPVGRTRMQRVFAGLGLRAPVRPSWVLVLSPAVAVALRAAGDWIAARIPDEGTAPVQALVSMPSGTLAYATVAVLVPFAEELFFRGFVYGTAVRRFGPVSAFVLAAALFSLAHVPQLWGAWGPLASVTLTGIVLTSLRAWSGSVLLPTFTHVAHNAVIVLSVFNPSA
jgi:hypothetical protein